ncbi:MAG: helix-turn-helix domain-containing protein [Microbacterium sp.]|jgi:transcriptional regulator of acetoin/glycerol metabolism|uniref:helix-turn-helix domain-containing protein n=1 Tax=Microbacterium sp. TaxID=51671 RepID=UPI002728B9AD|nr:helix-turn-helix domain-containing protein [Microbacterium sp.]MDO8381493.1 helix-turn-helix domain-containing protein [Microbacterium sp.]
MSIEEARSSSEIQAARQELLGAERSAAALVTRQRRVRATIERSWRRSIMTAEPSAPARFVSESDVAEPLLRAALPVLEYWLPSLEGSSAALFLSDRTGRIVARRVGDRSHARRLDKASAAEGFDFSERTLGTNGLGTAIEERAAVLVRGAEHFNDALQSLACAGAPILDLSTGRVLGSLSIAAPASTASQIMLTVARQAARQIEQEYAGNTLSPHLRSVLALVLRNAAGRPTLVISRDSVFSSIGSLPLVSPENHVLIWEKLGACDWSFGDHPITIAGRKGLAHRIGESGALAYIIEFDDSEPSAQKGDRSIAGTGPSDPHSMHAAGAHEPVPAAEPPDSLRDDPERIGELIRAFHASSGAALSAATMQALLRWDWPGGVAELKGLLTSLARDFPSGTVPLSALPESMRLRGTPTSGIAAAERRAIEAALRVTGGNRTATAGLLGVGRTTLWRKLRAYGIDERQYLAD